MNVIIPCCGYGQRFRDAGFSQPKPLVRAHGKEIIRWVLDSLPINSNVIIAYNNYLKQYNFENFILQFYPDVKFIALDDTRGAAETVYKTLIYYNIHDSFVSIDCDSFITDKEIYKSYGKNSVVCFKTSGVEECYSFYKTCDNSFIIDIAEKKKISDWAGCGVYFFRDSKEFLEHYMCPEEGEYYLSTIVYHMLVNNFTVTRVSDTDFHCLGTPVQLMLFCNNIPVNTCTQSALVVPSTRVCFDLDNTLVTPPRIKGDYTTVEPIQERIEFCKYLKRMNCQIIIYTARGMKSGRVNTLQNSRVIIDTLEKYDIPCDELFMGKPYADIYIDDKLVNIHRLQNETGFYNTRIVPRDFNSIDSNISTVTKKSEDLSPEIYYYNNIPCEVKDLFPVFMSHNLNNSEYTIEKVKGITLSELLVSNGTIDKKIFKTLLGSLKRLHNIKTHDQIDITQIYSKKLENRGICVDQDLLEYEKTVSNYCMIHGDPVFTNVLINNYGKLKFIDPRGYMGTKLTIYGDPMYDWAKVYQSLIGYDFILNDKEHRVCSELVEIFFDMFSPEEIKNIKMITKTLIMSLQPLHIKDFSSLLSIS